MKIIIFKYKVIHTINMPINSIGKITTYEELRNEQKALGIQTMTNHEEGEALVLLSLSGLKGDAYKKAFNNLEKFYRDYKAKQHSNEKIKKKVKQLLKRSKPKEHEENEFKNKL